MPRSSRPHPSGRTGRINPIRRWRPITTRIVPVPKDGKGIRKVESGNAAIEPRSGRSPGVGVRVAGIHPATRQVLAGSGVGNPFSAPALRVRRARRAGSPGRPAARDPRTPSAGGCQARLLPLHRVSSRTVPDQQPDQSGHLRPLSGHARKHRGGSRARGGERAGCRARQRRARPARGLLPGLAGHARHAGLRLRHQLRVRPVPPGDRQRRPEGKAGQLARPPDALGDRAARGGVPRPCLRPHRARRRPPGPVQPDVAGLAAPDRRAPRLSHRRLRRPDGEPPPALLRTGVA